MTSTLPSHSSFIGHELLISGSALDNALCIKRTLANNASARILSFDNRSGQQLDFDLSGSDEQIAQRLTQASEPEPEPAPGKRGRGRPKLGVVAREVTLLPRHWEWLSAQPGGASVTLRKLVDAARRNNTDLDQTRQRQERAYNFLSAIAGDLPGFEDATRALFRNDLKALATRTAEWPAALRSHLQLLLEAEA